MKIIIDLTEGELKEILFEALKDKFCNNTDCYNAEDLEIQLQSNIKPVIRIELERDLG